MLFRLEILPLVLHLVVDFQFGIALGIFKSHLSINGDEVGEEQGVGTLSLIVGTHGHEQEVERFRTFPHESLEQMEPSEGQQTALGFLKGTRERSH